MTGWNRDLHGIVVLKPFTEYFGHYQNNIDELVFLRFKTERLCKFSRQLLLQSQNSIVEWNILQSFVQNHCAKFVQMISALEVTQPITESLKVYFFLNYIRLGIPILQQARGKRQWHISFERWNEAEKPILANQRVDIRKIPT